jgi:ABC-type glycerol-3-phosphate transport system permease component
MSRKYYGEQTFLFFVNLIIVIMTLSCFLPLLHMVALSFSDKMPAMQGKVGFLPVKATLAPYRLILSDNRYSRAFFVSVLRVLAGTTINMAITVLTAYPLSYNKKEFPGRNIYMYYTLFTMMFYGGLVAWYITIKNVGLIGSFWSLVIPGGLPIMNAILVMNYFRNIPKELRESAQMDGAGHMKLLTQIILPVSLPVIATVTLFCIVGHWNNWLDGRMFINKQEWVPLQTYIQSLIFEFNNLSSGSSQDEVLEQMSNRNFDAAKIIIGSLPLMIVYPFLQRYFVRGITLGAVKG